MVPNCNPGVLGLHFPEDFNTGVFGFLRVAVQEHLGYLRLGTTVLEELTDGLFTTKGAKKLIKCCHRLSKWLVRVISF